jgi:predicted ATPase
MWLMQLPAVVESTELERLQHRIKGATRERMVRELNDVLERLTTEATLVLVLEDLHWSDVATVELLSSIAHRSEAARLLIVGTYRPAEAAVSDPVLLQSIRELRGRGLCKHLNVELLTRRDVGEYVAARLGGTDSEDVADQVFERSGGNALFMVNVFDHLMQARAIRKLDDRWIVDGAAAALSEVPEGLRPFIQCRLDTLSAEDRRILETASVVGVDFAAAALPPGSIPADLKQDLERLETRLEALAERTRLIEDCGVAEWPGGILSDRFRFRHALYRKGLYDEIPEARRARLHRMIGEHLRAAFGPEAAPLAAVLAVHFENGQDAESAARYRRMAGERALGRHAYHEAAQHLQRALDTFDQARDRPADGALGDLVRWELDVCTMLGTTLATIHGYSAPEVARINSRARSLIEQLDDPASQFRALLHLWSFSQVAAESDLSESYNLVTRMSELAARMENDELALMCSSVRSRTRILHGDLPGCAEDLQRLFTACDPRGLADLHSRYCPAEHALYCLGADACRLWLQGYPDQALARISDVRALAENLDRPYGHAVAGYMALHVLQFCGQTAQLDRQARDLRRLCAEHGFSLWSAWATCIQGWAVGARGDVAEGIALMVQGVEAFRDAGARVNQPFCLALLAELYLRAGRIEAAHERLAEARTRVEISSERYWDAEVHRLEGEVLLAAAEDGGRDRDDRAEACFRSALEIARRQQARSLELRAALSLSRLWSRSRSDEARRLLGGVLETFSEGHDTADLRAASEQMARLSRAD